MLWIKIYIKLIVIKAAADKLEKADDYNVAYDHLKEKKAAWKSTENIGNNWTATFDNKKW